MKHNKNMFDDVLELSRKISKVAVMINKVGDY